MTDGQNGGRSEEGAHLVPDPPVRILQVEDDPSQAELVRHLLEQEGWEVSTVATGVAAIDAAEMNRPHLVFMDIGLEGGMDGVEAGFVVHRRTGLPVVFVTGRADRETMVRAREAEPFGYLIKPIDPAQLRATVEMALQKARLVAEQEALVKELEEARETIRELRDRLGE